jgi:hypothetical protein
MVSSRPQTTTPHGTNTATNRLSSSRLAVRGDQTARFRTRCSRCTWGSALSPITRSAAVMVRRPGARMAPVRSPLTGCQPGFENTGAKTAMTLIHVVGRERIAILSYRHGGLMCFHCLSIVTQITRFGQSRAERVSQKGPDVVPNVSLGLSLLMNGEWWGRESACTQRYGCAPRSSRGAKWGQIQSFRR